MIDSIDFAVYLNEKIKARGKTANKTKLQKLLYICYGSQLRMNEGQQLLNEQPNAWDYGPAFPRVYSVQKSSSGLDKLSPLHQRSKEKLEQFDVLIERVLDFFGDWTANQLVEWTHTEETAWHKKYSNIEERYTPLNNSDILMDFKRYIK